MNRDDLLSSLIRTVVPIVVGLVGASVIGPHVDLKSLDQAFSAIISVVYYTVVRFAEAKHPAASLLLGSRKVPTYFDSKV